VATGAAPPCKGNSSDGSEDGEARLARLAVRCVASPWSLGPSRRKLGEQARVEERGGDQIGDIVRHGAHAELDVQLLTWPPPKTTARRAMQAKEREPFWITPDRERERTSIDVSNVRSGSPTHRA
jgi:hypothetical protein